MNISRRELLWISLGSSASILASTRPLFATQNVSLSSQGSDGLRAHADAHGLLVGAAVKTSLLRWNPQFAALVQNQANILVAEFEMKWDALRPAPNQYDFTSADWLVSYAQSNGQRFRGHNLCWHQALPSWFADYASTDNARTLLSQHIQTVVGRYKGKIHSWDVVNEAIDPSSKRSDGLRLSPWLSLAGSDYIDFAFRVARDADPNALLTYNESALEGSSTYATEKRSAVLALVTGMKSRGVPIDAVGIESHLDTQNFSFSSELISFIQALDKLGVQVFITEMDVNDQSLEASVSQRDVMVAAIYQDYLGAVFSQSNVKALLTWELRDCDSWLQFSYPRADGTPLRPLPFDDDYNPKAAFLSIRNAIDARQ